MLLESIPYSVLDTGNWAVNKQRTLCLYEAHMDGIKEFIYLKEKNKNLK
jgi:hypothetical protein